MLGSIEKGDLWKATHEITLESCTKSHTCKFWLGNKDAQQKTIAAVVMFLFRPQRLFFISGVVEQNQW